MSEALLAGLVEEEHSVACDRKACDVQASSSVVLAWEEVTGVRIHRNA